MRADHVNQSRGVMRQYQDPLDKRQCALYAIHEFVETLYDIVPERRGRYVIAQQQWVADATPIDVGDAIAFEFNHQIWRLDNIMAARSNKKPEYQRIEYEFVKAELTSDQKTEAKDWIEKNSDDYEMLIADMIVSDYKMSISYDSYNDSFVVSCTGKPDNKYNAGKILTGRGKTWFLALMSTLYKHVVLFNSAGWRTDGPVGSDDFS